MNKTTGMRGIPAAAGARIVAASAFAFLLSALVSCEPLPPIGFDEGAGEDSRLPFVFHDIAEAEQIALYLDEEPRMNRFLMKRVFYDLSLIRGAFGDRIEEVRTITFVPPCSGRSILLYFEDVVFDSVVAGEYLSWTPLNDFYRPVAKRTDDRLDRVYLYFEEQYDFEALASEYSGLPGVIEARCIAPIGDYPNVYARRTEYGITYLFREAWEDCPAGCKRNRFHYFICENDDAILVGTWDPEEGPPPDWWVEAARNLPEGDERFEDLAE